MYEERSATTAETKPESTPGFAITGRKGFHITFENGWTVSVQFGPGNYSDNYRANFRHYDTRDWSSSTAEVAAWDANGKWLDLDGDNVAGYYTPKQVLALMLNCATEPDLSSQESPNT